MKSSKTYAKGFRFLSVSTASAAIPMDLFQRDSFVRLLELPATLSSSLLSLSQEQGKQLFKDGKIHGVVHPDLPPKFSLTNLSLQWRVNQKLQNHKYISELTDGSSDFMNVTQGGFWQVKTVAAQTRTIQDLHICMVDACKAIDMAGCGGALLLVSGGHYMRSFWLFNRLLPAGSFAMLHAAHQLRQNGLLAPGVQLWAVENPLVNSVDRLEKKIEAGAEAIILQPPLLQDRFGAWWESVDQRGLLKAARLIVGAPIISSAKNFAFWLKLTGSSGKEAEAALQKFQQAESLVDNTLKDEFFRTWTLNLFHMIKNLPEVAGMHLMPMTPYGWRNLADFSSNGEL